MENQYQVDLKQFTMKKFKQLLENAKLLPSQKMLKEKLSDYFARIEKQGIDNLFELQRALKSKKDSNMFSEKSGIPLDHLILLRREVNSYNTKPRTIEDFQEIDRNLVRALEKMRIKNTMQLFNHITTDQKRKALAKETGTSLEKILELARLTDIVRLRYVNQPFALLLVRAGYDSIEKVSKADYQKLFQEIKEVNEEKHYFNGSFGMDDMKMMVTDAKEVFRTCIQY